MSDGRRHGSDDFQLSVLKSAMSGSSSSSQNASRVGDVLSSQYSRDEAAQKETQLTLLQLASMVREKRILYDEDLQASLPEAQLKQEKRDAWNEIRKEMMWQDISAVQDVWSELLEQYASRKPHEMPDSIIEALRWTEAFQKNRKVDSRPPSQLNNLASVLEKDFFGDTSLNSEDVLVPGHNIESPSSLNMIRDYVVIQPQQRRHLELEGHPPIQSNTTQYSRRKSPSPRETEAIVRTYPLGTKRRSINARPQELGEQKPKNSLHHSNKKDSGQQQMNYGRPGVLVEVEPGYPTVATPKMYKMIRRNTPPPTPQQAATASVATARRIYPLVQRANSLSYDSMPPEPLIEPLSRSASPTREPPKKKPDMHRESRHRRVNLVGPSTPKTIRSEVPIADDEIILEPDGECKPLVDDPTDHPSTSSDIHHYHHQEIGIILEVDTVVEDIGDEVVVGGPPDPLTMQYDEDLAFQQHINSVLNRLSEDEKLIMKFNMQKIIVDVRFGGGTARNMLKDDEHLLEVATHVDIDDSGPSDSRI